jgi:hypothetical protein
LTAVGLVFFVSLFIYLLTLAPSVFWWDSGEFIANTSVLGIPHRPGFPIYVLLAKVISSLVPLKLAWTVNFFSALTASLGLSLGYLLFTTFSRHLFHGQEDKSLVTWTSLASVLILGFCYSFWIQAVRAEVYSLAFLFFIILVWAAIKSEFLSSQPLKYLVLFAFIFGLSLGNHHAIMISVLPGLAFLLVSSRHCHSFPRVIPSAVLALILGLSVYLYLPLRASQGPLLSWGDLSNLSSYFGTVLAVDSASQINWLSIDKLSFLAGSLNIILQQLTLFPFILAIVGFIVAYLTARRWFWFFVLVTISNWLVVAALTDQFIADNPDLHGYLLPSIFVWAAAFGWGGIYLTRLGLKFFSQSIFTAGMRKVVSLILVSFLLLLSLVPFFRSKAAADLSSNQIPHDYAYQAVASLKPNSLIVIDNPNLDFLLRGLQYGQDFRKDLIIIDRTLLPAGWYVKQLKRNHPSIFGGISAGLRGERLAITLAKICLNRGETVYWEFTEQDSALVGYLQPAGYLCEIVQHPDKSGSAWQEQAIWEQRHLDWDNDPAFGHDGDAQRVYSKIMYQLGYFYQCAGELGRAKAKYEKVLALSPDEPLVSFRLQQIREAQTRAER